VHVFPSELTGIVELRGKGETLRVENVLYLIVRLKQICDFCPVSGRSAKFEVLVAGIWFACRLGYAPVLI